ncbi:S41 family peptidase [Tenuifilum thalassicum]|uniref:Tricorn protease homolog n=1 Tax=Tenuifilum thalassicum TaxID=2590900 RepID=A0A7D3XUP7_9BACT|nr:S41 family peptidase [Tenuifilum thalassicum]QKG79228.1 peptidase S41 [Tenuifilum thalassicum]
MKRLLFLLFGLTSLSAISQNDVSWYRYPSISPDGKTIAFVYKGDIFTVPAQGGKATALTSHPAHDYMPVWSNDGKKIAFASNRYGNMDVFIMPANGGTPTRLTYHSNDELPYAFTPNDSAVVFGATRYDPATSRLYPTKSQPELYSVSAHGGLVTQILPVPAEAVNISSDGRFIIYHDKKGGENEFRKHHKSSIARDLWMYDTKTKQFTKLTDYKGEDRNPVFAPGDSVIYFLREEDSFNVYSFSLSKPNQVSKVTDFNTHPVRFLSASNSGTFCFGFDGGIYTLQPNTKSPQKVNISISNDYHKNPEEFTNLNGSIREIAISPDGKEVAFIARGEVFVTSVDGEFTKRITQTSEQERFVEFLPDGKGLVYASERDGRWQIFKATKVRDDEPFFFASTLINEEPLISNEHDNYLPLPSPDGKKIAFIEDRMTLKVLDLDSKKTFTLLTPNELYYMSDGDQYFTWSPDSKWLLVEYAPTMANQEVILVSADGSVPFKNLTMNGYDDFSPIWANGGKQVVWLSTRQGLRSYANSGERQADVYTLFLTREAWDKFRLSKDEYNLLKAIEKKKKEDEKKKANDKGKDKKKKSKNKEQKADSSLKFDWDGFEYRVARLTTTSTDIAGALLSKDGETLYYLASYDKGYNLWSMNIREKEAKIIIIMDADNASLYWDKDEKNMFMLADGKIYKVEVDKEKHTAIKVKADAIIDTPAERLAMFNHVVIRTRKGFYTPTYHGINWDAMTDHYKQFLPHIGNSFEFAELLSELLGELNVSHSGARYYNYESNADQTASLGIIPDLTYNGNGIKVDEILVGGPLDRKEFNLKAPFIITSIDGISISNDRDWAYYLNHKADQYLLISVKDLLTVKEKQITVKPTNLSEESRLLYRRWVKRNADEVEQLSDGKLGYVHIPGMSDGPYRNIYGEMMGKYFDREGIIVDTRFNGGGDLVSDLAMFFTGKKFIEYHNHIRQLGVEPTFRWTKPTVAMVNEANYSDGSCFACGYKQLGIGKLIGMPVPGTCSFAGWERLQDRQVLWGMVPVSAKDMYGNWMENVETVPDYVVPNEPSVAPFGRDQQLEKAIKVLMEN